VSTVTPTRNSGGAPSTDSLVTPSNPVSGHVTIEHTKKTIKAQRVMARVLFGVGVVLLFVESGIRFQLAFGVMAGAVLWLVWLRILRWWEHA